MRRTGGCDTTTSGGLRYANPPYALRAAHGRTQFDQSPFNGTHVSNYLAPRFFDRAANGARTAVNRVLISRLYVIGYERQLNPRWCSFRIYREIALAEISLR